MLVAAAIVPTPPLLVPDIAGGSAVADEPMRAACGAAVTRLIAAGLDELVVVGGGGDGLTDGSWDWRGFGVAVPAVPPPRRLPLALAIGSWLLDTYASSPPRRYCGVADTSRPQECAALGRELVGGTRRVGLLVCGDGSASRTEKAPGFRDPDAEPWDAAALEALRTADADALLRLDTEVATRVQAAGRAPWQVLAGAAGDAAFEAIVDWADAPYGVLYVVGTWIRKDET